MPYDDETAFFRDELDVDILMHREAHFSGSFSAMLDYYKKGGKGVQGHFPLGRIQDLARYEESTECNLAPILLSGPEMEKLGRVKEAYDQLRELFESTQDRKSLRLIGDLILAEETEPAKEMQEIIKQGKAIVPLLIETLRQQTLYDPLFPGYGLSPMLIAKCLAEIGDKRAIIFLFEQLGHSSEGEEDEILSALKVLGKPACDFLLHVVSGKPINADNEQAALALISFKEAKVSKKALSLLSSSETWDHPVFVSYLLLACEALPEEMRVSFQELKNMPKAKAFTQDIEVYCQEWGWDSLD